MNTLVTPVIGMETHTQLKTKSKMFCGCKNDPFGAEKPNLYTCQTCLGLPGALPVANKRAVEMTIKLGLFLNCKINLYSKFDRKHYFYPDLPKGYQISQHDLPLCYDGYITTSFGKVRIRRIHIEEDTGKLQHTSINGERVTLVDFNRSSVPLVEVVTEPDISSPEHAKEYARRLRDTFQYLEFSSCDMDKGEMRLEANISVKAQPSDHLPHYKVELKNINSFTYLGEAIEYEIDRQSNLIDEGTQPKQETRGWDVEKKQSFPQRLKEEAEDYRYFPDPDLPPISFTEVEIDELKGQLPAPIESIAESWQSKYRVSEKVTKKLIRDTKYISSIDTLFQHASAEGMAVATLATRLVDGKIQYANKPTADVLSDFKKLHTTVELPEEEITQIAEKVVREYHEAVKKYLDGHTNSINYLIGMALKLTGKKVDVAQVREAVQSRIESEHD